MIEQDPRITEGPTFFQSLYAWMKRVAIDVNQKTTLALVEAALPAMATAAGFAFSFGTTSYIKFPSWLGSWVVQWGNSSGTTSSSLIGVTFPLTFPTACRAALAVSAASSVTLALPISTAKSTTGFNAVFVTPAAGGGGGNTGVGGGISVTVDWIALGN